MASVVLPAQFFVPIAASRGAPKPSRTRRISECTWWSGAQLYRSAAWPLRSRRDPSNADLASNAALLNQNNAHPDLARRGTVDCCPLWVGGHIYIWGLADLASAWSCRPRRWRGLKLTRSLTARRIFVPTLHSRSRSLRTQAVVFGPRGRAGACCDISSTGGRRTADLDIHQVNGLPATALPPTAR